MAKCAECIYGTRHGMVISCEKTHLDVPAEDDLPCNMFLKKPGDPVNRPNHYVGKIECIDYLRDKLTPEEFTGFCMGNVLKYSSRWRKKDGLQDLKKAKVYLEWAIENEETQSGNTECKN